MRHLWLTVVVAVGFPAVSFADNDVAWELRRQAFEMQMQTAVMQGQADETRRHNEFIRDQAAKREREADLSRAASTIAPAVPVALDGVWKVYGTFRGEGGQLNFLTINLASLRRLGGYRVAQWAASASQKPTTADLVSTAVMNCAGLSMELGWPVKESTVDLSPGHRTANGYALFTAACSEGATAKR